MQTNNPSDSLHKAWLYRVLVNIVDNQKLAALYFKGGTCAALRGLLDRFSLDLDFDYVGSQEDLPRVRKELKKIFSDLGLEIKDESKKVPQFFLKYPTNKISSRNTLKIDITFPAPRANVYEPVRLNDISRVVNCQDKRTMFANKLVAVLDRFKRNGSIAGRDIYDIHYFFTSGHSYNTAVIKERTGLEPLSFFRELRNFVDKHINDTILSQDLSSLLPYETFRGLRKTLKLETIALISAEIERLRLKDQL